MVTIFKSEHGEVWKSPNGYGTLTAGHMLCVDLAKEIERLRAELAVYRARAELQQAELTSEQLTMLHYEREAKKSEAQRVLDKRLEDAKRKEP